MALIAPYSIPSPSLPARPLETPKVQALVIVFSNSVNHISRCTAGLVLAGKMLSLHCNLSSVLGNLRTYSALFVIVCYGQQAVVQVIILNVRFILIADVVRPAKAGAFSGS